MVRSCFTALALGFTAGAAAKSCKELKVPVDISARNAEFSLKAPATDVDVADFNLNFNQQGANLTDQLLTGYKTVSGTYEIAATYCTPSKGEAGKALQILTHGVGFDRSYYDFPYGNHNYSYVNHALDRGYSTFTYDRLGIGESSHGDPVNEIQSELEMSALEFLTDALRSNKLAGVPENYQKIVHVGHSYGSIQTYGLTARDTSFSDGIALTGFSMYTGGMNLFMYAANWKPTHTTFKEQVLSGAWPDMAMDPSRQYDAGYISSGNIRATQTNFFGSGNFDQAVLEELHSKSQPAAVGEILTLSTPVTPSNAFEGPVLILSGERDLPFCGGNCKQQVQPNVLEQGATVFTNATSFETFMVPGAGHAPFLEYTSPMAYKKVLDFFDEKVMMA